MGVVSSLEDIERKRQEAEVSGRKSDPELKALLAAPTDKRTFERKSAPAPNLKKSKKKLKAEALYRERKQRQDANKKENSVDWLRAQVETLLTEKQQLLKQLSDMKREITRLRSGKA